MSLEKILDAVTKKKPELKREAARAIAADILYSGEEPENVLASDSTIDRLISGYKSRQAATGARNVEANDPTTCPICKVPLKPIKLADDRSAVFCSKHFVVFPIPAKGEGK